MRISPVPLHWGHVFIPVPSLAPVPLHFSQDSLLEMLIVFFFFFAASIKVILRASLISLPLTGAFLLVEEDEKPPENPPQKRSLKISNGLKPPENPDENAPLRPSKPNWSYCLLLSGSLNTL